MIGFALNVELKKQILNHSKIKPKTILLLFHNSLFIFEIYFSFSSDIFNHQVLTCKQHSFHLKFSSKMSFFSKTNALEISKRKINASYMFCLMLISSSEKRTLYLEIFKVLIISLPLFIGGVIFTYYLSKGFSSLRNYLFYLIIAIIIILGQIILFFIRRNNFMDSKLNTNSHPSSAPSTLTHNSSSSPKESIKIDEYSVSYCLSCGKSFTKKYSFCPKCGSCKISSFI